jgi:hypothetical protein
MAELERVAAQRGADANEWSRDPYVQIYLSGDTTAIAGMTPEKAAEVEAVLLGSGFEKMFNGASTEYVDRKVDDLKRTVNQRLDEVVKVSGDFRTNIEKRYKLKIQKNQKNQ